MKSLFSIVDTIVPLTLFHVKRLAKPKASDGILRSIAIVIYFCGIATFVALFTTQSHSYTKETQIELTDISDSEWTCSMASVVTQSVSLNNSGDPIEFYNLLSVSELESDCLASLSTANPCANEESILYTPGAVNDNYYFVDMVAASSCSASSGNVFYFYVYESYDEPYKSFKYDVTSGILSAGAVGTVEYFPSTFFKDYPWYLPSTVAMNKAGQGYFVTTSVVEYEDTFRNEFWVIDFNGENYITFDIYANLTSVLMTNDNNLNVYVLISQFDVASSSYISELAILIAISDDDVDVIGTQPVEQITTKNETITQFAVYSLPEIIFEDDKPIDESELYVYYLLANNTFGGDLYVYHEKKSLLLFSSTECVIESIQVSAIRNMVYFTVTNHTDRSSQLMSADSDGIISLIVRYDSESNIPAFTMINNETQFMLTFGEGMYQYDITSGTYEQVRSGFTDTVAGWYACGDQLVTSSLPSNIYSPGSCSGNGITWQIQYTGSYFSTPSAFQQQAIAEAYSRCQSSTIYETICDRVGSLPPYICTRKQYLPFFTIFATAIANAHLLVVILFLVCGAILSKLDPASSRKKTDVENVEMHNVNPIMSGSHM